MRRKGLAAVAVAAGLAIVPLTAAPAAADVIRAQADVAVPGRDGSSTTCTVIGFSEVTYDPEAGPNGTSRITFGALIEDSEVACYRFSTRIQIIASYRRDQDESWLTAEASADEPPDASGAATVPGPVVDVEVFHRVQLYNASCDQQPRPVCGPGEATFTTDPK